MASYHSFGSYIAEVAEVTVEGNSFKIDRMVAAIDCGQVVNPESVRAQAESAIIYGLSAALKNEITIKNGAVEQSNFDAYDPIRIHEAPPIEVYIANSKEDPGGMGEPARGLPRLPFPVGTELAARCAEPSEFSGASRALCRRLAH